MRSVIVTGGSRGLGLAISLALTAQGYQVIAIARSETAELLAGIESASGSGPGRLHFRACDLSRTSEIAKFVGALRKESAVPSRYAWRRWEQLWPSAAAMPTR